MEPVSELTRKSPLGSLVCWSTLDGSKMVGRLREWDNGTAIVVMSNGTEKSVRCDE